MLKNLRHVTIVATTTFGSRILGLARDVLLFFFLGTSIWNSAFIVAFTIPNLFRRLLGEGALTSAVVPLLSEQLEQEHTAAAGYRFINRVLTRLTLILLAITATGVLLAWGVRYIRGLSANWYLVAELSLVMLPYMIFICLSAILGASLNVLGRFGIPALSPIWLNLCIIGSLLWGGVGLGVDPAQLTLLVSWGVLVGGFFQWVIPGIALRREGWKPHWDSSQDPSMHALWKLLLPGLAGAAVLQVNILISRLIAYSIHESAVSVLYLAGRLMELPLGVFTIAVVTVLFPELSRKAAARDEQGMAQSFQSGNRQILAITIPAAIGLIILGKPILDLLFNYGAFSARDVSATLPVLAIYGVGLPFYSLATIGVRGMHAFKDMVTPVRIACLALFTNVVFSLVLMFPFQERGLAAANVLSAMLQCFLILRAFQRANPHYAFRDSINPLKKIGIAATLMAALCYGWIVVTPLMGLEGKWLSVVQVGLGVPGGVFVYFAILQWFGLEDLDVLKAAVIRKLRGGGSSEAI